MRKLLTFFLVLPLSLFSLTTAAQAGSRYSYHYRHNSPYYGYHHHAPYRYHGDAWLPMLGVGLLTGAMIGTLVSPPPRTVYYSTQPVTVYSPQINTKAPLIEEPEVVLRQVTITEKLVNVRSGPGLDTAVLTRVSAGQVVDVIGAAPEWLYIRMVNGEYGWIMTRYTTEAVSPVG